MQMVVKRAAQEANFHKLYIKLVDKLGEKEFYKSLVSAGWGQKADCQAAPAHACGLLNTGASCAQPCFESAPADIPAFFAESR